MHVTAQERRHKVCETQVVEDLVAIEVRTKRGQFCYFLTWGRIQDAVDPAPLAELILSVADQFSVPGAPDSARVCGSLQEARGAPLFYEGLFEFAQRPIPFGPDYETWRIETDAKMRTGKEIYFAGPVEGSGGRTRRPPV
jgi:hypothetical protein